MPDDAPLDPSGFVDPGRPRYCARCGAPLEEQDRGDRVRPVCPRCGWTYYAKNALGAAILVERPVVPTGAAGAVSRGSIGGATRPDTAAREILLVQRAHDPYAGDWMLPAGFVEFGEDAAATAVREAMEECALGVRLDGQFGIYFGTDDPRNPAYLIVYRATPTDPVQQPVAGDDACAVGWFAEDRLPPNIAFAAQRQAIAEWVEHGLG